MTDLYNKEDKADKTQQLKARLAHLGDVYVELSNELKSVTLEIERVTNELEFGDQAGD